MKLASQGFDLDFDSFYQANFRDTVSVVYGLTADMPEAQDIAQEAFVRAWQRWEALVNYENPVFWVRRVAANLATSRWRRAKVAAAYLVRQRPLDTMPELSPANIDIINALKKLPVTQRKAIVLHYLVDMAVDDVAAEFDVPVGTVKSWLHRGRAALSEELADEVRMGAPASDVGQVKQISGRRRAQRRVAATVAVFLAVLIGGLALLKPGRDGAPQPPATPSPSVSPLPMAPSLPASCQPALLPLPSGLEDARSRVRGGDPSGKYLYGTAISGQEVHSLIWTDGVVTGVFPVGRLPASIRAMNIHGIAVGANGYVDGPLARQAFYVRDGKQVPMRGVWPHPVAINASNVAAGSSDFRPAVWRDLDKEPEFLPLPPGYNAGTAYSIRDDGLIVGIAAKADSAAKEPDEGLAVAWHPSGEIQVLDPSEHYPWVWLEGDYVVMGSFSGGTKYLNIRTGATGDSPQGRINRHGWLVQPAPGGLSITDGAPSMVVSKSQILAGASEPQTISIVAVSPDGRAMAGYAHWLDGHERPLRWTCS